MTLYSQKHKEASDGMRVHQDVLTIKQLLREKSQWELVTHYLRFFQRKLVQIVCSFSCVESEIKTEHGRKGNG